MPTCSGDGEEISLVGGDMEDVEGSVMLEEEVPVNGDAADVFEHL